MPIMNAQGALGYARISRPTLPTGLVWVTVGANPVTSPNIGASNYGIITDSTGNIICVGMYQITANLQRRAYLVKLTIDGTFSYGQYVPGFISRSTFFLSVAVDSSDNLYAVGSGYDLATAKSTFLLAKYSNSGTVLWQNQLLGSGDASGTDIAVSSSGTSYIIGGDFLSPNWAIVVSSYSTSGSLLWSKKFTQPTTTTIFNGSSIVVDSSGNSYSLCSGTSNYLVKLDSSGSTVWQKKISSTFSTGDSSLSISGSTISMSYNTASNTSRGYILFDLDGNITQQRSISVGTSTAGSVMDELGNIYLLGQSTNVVYITKINSLGQFVYARQISSSSSSSLYFGAESITYKNNKLYLALSASGNSGAGPQFFFTMSIPTSGFIPTNGILPITINSVAYTVNYASTSGSVSTTSYTTTTGDLTIGSSGATSSTSPFTPGSTSLNWVYATI
jgi:hypothetical protein